MNTHTKTLIVVVPGECAGGKPDLVDRWKPLLAYRYFADPFRLIVFFITLQVRCQPAAVSAGGPFLGLFLERFHESAKGGGP